MKLTKLLCICSLILTASNVNAKDISQSLATCSQIKLNTDRLACFDLLSSKHKISPVIKVKSDTNKESEESAQKPKTVTRDQSNVAEEFGASHLKTISEKVEDNKFIILTVSQVNKNAQKMLVISFENGHVWLQKDKGFFRTKVGDKVRLTKRALGGIYLKKDDDSKRSIRVKRIK